MQAEPDLPLYDTLLLDQCFAPIRIIPWQKAFCMGLHQRVEVLCQHVRPIRGVDRDYAAPAVVRLLGPRRPEHDALRFSRVGVYRRDGYSCQYCGRRLRRDQCTLDHVIPRHLGGPTTWQNVVTACGPCNTKKGGHTLDEVRMQPRRRPERPRWLPVGRDTFGAWIPEVWHAWLAPFLEKSSLETAPLRGQKQARRARAS